MIPTAEAHRCHGQGGASTALAVALIQPALAADAPAGWTPELLGRDRARDLRDQPSWFDAAQASAVPAERWRP